MAHKRNKKGQLLPGHKGLKPKGAISTKRKDWNEMRDYIKDELVPEYVDKVKNMMESGDEKIEIEGMNKMLHILEYFAPKLQRTELTGKDDEPVSINVRFEDSPE